LGNGFCECRRRKDVVEDQIGEKVILRGLQTDDWFLDVQHVETDETAVGQDDNWIAEGCTGTKTLLVVDPYRVVLTSPLTRHVSFSIAMKTSLDTASVMMSTDRKERVSCQNIGLQIAVRRALMAMV